MTPDERRAWRAWAWTLTGYAATLGLLWVVTSR